MKIQLNADQRFLHAAYRGLLGREPDKRGLEYYEKALKTSHTCADVLEEFMSCEEFRQKSDAKLFAPPGHFYSPIADPRETDAHLSHLESRETPHALPGIAIDPVGMRVVWRELAPFIASNPFPTVKTHGFRYAFDNENYSNGDGMILHAMLRLHRPRRVIEVGSGWSSACTLDTVERHLVGNTRVTFVEPYPKLLKSLIGPMSARVDLHACKVQDAPMRIFEELEAGDILFIDSTHVLRTGSDVCFELFEILPRLASGVIVHIHDIFWPFEYPRRWAVDENRSWNELYAVRAFLTDNPSWRILFFNDYFAKVERHLIEANCPAFLVNSGGALWLQRV